MTAPTEGTAPALQGEGNVSTPAPAPAPDPAPVSHEGLLHELASHVRVVAASADRDVSELVAWLASHGL